MFKFFSKLSYMVTTVDKSWINMPWKTADYLDWVPLFLCESHDLLVSLPSCSLVLMINFLWFSLTLSWGGECQCMNAKKWRCLLPNRIIDIHWPLLFLISFLFLSLALHFVIFGTLIVVEDSHSCMYYNLFQVI